MKFRNSLLLALLSLACWSVEGQIACGQCTPSGHSCVSRTQYVSCNDGIIDPNAEVMSCADDELCVATSLLNVICVPKCVLDYVRYDATCANEEQPTSTSPRPSEEERQQACIDQLAGAEPTSYFFALNPLDPQCRTYIYCEKDIRDNWKALYLPCPANKFFNLATQVCQETVPAGCE
ncbi:uncharacterized protein LOC115622377 [Scaptodrosophila lebanonensis]|uniref:Uncharacterized protein LOC115622377 n=1 Tax=Drosophila lebanonensis TaxID=7225 RepID=A0A6J2T9Z6_DROLE|nr:uncharacterized protein LOC115622377 [Scaptodrosophila lebanonensis]